MQWRPLISLAVVAVCVCIAIACHRQSVAVDDPGSELSGEPEQFSATIVCAVDEGVERELSVTRIFKSGNLRREEWIEQGESRALIWRPDLGKTHLLDIDRRCYVERDIMPDSTPNGALKVGSESTASQNRLPEVEPADRSSANVSRHAISGEALDRAFDHAPSPVRVENRRFADQTIDAHPCAVFERREIFAGNHIEVTRTSNKRLPSRTSRGEGCICDPFLFGGRASAARCLAWSGRHRPAQPARSTRTPRPASAAWHLS